MSKPAMSRQQEGFAAVLLLVLGVIGFCLVAELGDLFEWEVTGLPLATLLLCCAMVVVGFAWGVWLIWRDLA